MIFLSGNLLAPDMGLLFWQTLTFLIVLFLLAKYAWKPILGSIKEREKNIEDSLAQAEKARQDMQQLTADNEKILADARTERDKMLVEAKETANKMVADAKQAAQDAGKKELAEAKEAINNQKMAAMTELRNLVGTLSIDIAEKLIQNKFEDKSAQERLVESYLKDINLN